MIDVGQAVDTGHPKALEFLRRDLSVVSSFFRRKEVGGCLADGLAERFVVGYPGPFPTSSSPSEARGDGRSGGEEGQGVAAADGGEGEGEETPLAGVELVLEVRERKSLGNWLLTGQATFCCHGSSNHEVGTFDLRTI